MSLLKVIERARAVLHVDASASPKDVKRAYRRRVREAPPDRMPEEFRRVRDAYELLQDLETWANEALMSRTPSVDPPRLQLPTVDRGSTAVAMLRAMAGRLDERELVGLEAVEASDGG